MQSMIQWVLFCFGFIIGSREPDLTLTVQHFWAGLKKINLGLRAESHSDSTRGDFVIESGEHSSILAVGDREKKKVRRVRYSELANNMRHSVKTALTPIRVLQKQCAEHLQRIEQPGFKWGADFCAYHTVESATDNLEPSDSLEAIFGKRSRLQNRVRKSEQNKKSGQPLRGGRVLSTLRNGYRYCKIRPTTLLDDESSLILDNFDMDSQSVPKVIYSDLSYPRGFGLSIRNNEKDVHSILCYELHTNLVSPNAVLGLIHSDLSLEFAPQYTFTGFGLTASFKVIQEENGVIRVIDLIVQDAGVGVDAFLVGEGSGLRGAYFPEISFEALFVLLASLKAANFKEIMESVIYRIRDDEMRITLLYALNYD